MGSCHGPWNSGVVSFVWPLLASQSSTRRLSVVRRNTHVQAFCCPRPVLTFGYCRCLRLSVCPSDFTIWKKGKEELLPLQCHIKSLHIISRHYKKSLLRSPIYLGYEELSTDTSYPIWRRQKEERRSKYAMQLASWQLRSNSPKTSVCVCGNHVLVRSITHHPFKLGPQNLDQRCKIPWLRSLLFWWWIELDMSNLTYFQNPVCLHRFCVSEIFVRPIKTTVALKGHHYISFSLHYINFDLCENNIMWLCIHNYLACIHNYLACIHKYLACIHNYLACIHN